MGETKLKNSTQDLSQQISLLQQCLSGSKKPIGLFLGAGCPMAVGTTDKTPLIPDMARMTIEVRNLLSSSQLCGPFRTAEKNLRKDGLCNPNLEDLLTHIRGLSAIAGSESVRGLTPCQLVSLDRKICDLINQVVNKELPHDDTAYHQVARWADGIPRGYPVELFTTNYDMLLEQALEESQVPYFDGFPGVRRPFFDPRALEEASLLPPWTRLWKLHGSINWYQHENELVFRGTTDDPENRRVIHPSHLKYQESRRMPYLAMVDRLRTFLNDPAAALILCGYSFRDQHINDTIRQGLQHTQTAVAFGLMFGVIEDYEYMMDLAKNRPNLNILAKNGGIIGGRRVDWLERESDAVLSDESVAITWETMSSPDKQNKQEAQFNLGNFEVFGKFLRQLIGERPSLPEGGDDAP